MVPGVLPDETRLESCWASSNAGGKGRCAEGMEVARVCGWVYEDDWNWMRGYFYEDEGLDGFL